MSEAVIGARCVWLPVHLREGVGHPGLPLAGRVAQPPGHGDGAIRVHLDLSLVIQFVLESRWPFEHESGVGHLALIAISFLGERPVVAEEDDAKLLRFGVVAPVVDALLGWFEATVASVNSALQRARKSIEERLPERSQQVTLRSLGDERVRDIVERYIDAWERGNVKAIAAMLTKDATFAMPPYPNWWRGREVIAAFAAGPVHRYVPTRANGQAANAAYRWDPDKGIYAAEALEVLTLDGAQVKEMIAFMTPDVFPRFGLPDELPR